jgi:hypothetical protein
MSYYNFINTINFKNTGVSYTNYFINDIKSFFKNIDENSIESMDEIFIIANIKISYYQIFINILFLVIICGTLYILYRDYIYRIANKATRCTDINDIVNFNIDVNEDSYIYNIYIVHENNTKNILEDFVLKLEYNFVAEQTIFTLGKYNNILPVLFTPDNNISKIGNAFYIFDLEEKKKKYIDYYEKENKVIYYINKKKIANKKYKYFVTSNTDKKLNDDSSKQLAYFVRKFGYNDNINLDPIYNILYAIENKKNMEY